MVNTAPTKPVTASLSGTDYDGKEMVEYLEKKCKCIFVNANDVCKPFGSSKFFNIIMVGIAAGSGRLGIGKETLLNEIRRRVPARFAEKNAEAFLAGYEIGGKQ